MAYRNFVLLLDENIPEHVAQKIGERLTSLREEGVDSAARTMEALLQDVNLGITDNLLLKTSHTPAALESLFREHLGKYQKYWSIQWVT